MPWSISACFDCLFCLFFFFFFFLLEHQILLYLHLPLLRLTVLFGWDLQSFNSALAGTKTEKGFRAHFVLGEMTLYYYYYHHHHHHWDWHNFICHFHLSITLPIYWFIRVSLSLCVTLRETRRERKQISKIFWRMFCDLLPCGYLLCTSW